ncbi:hypothetical protein RJT34_15574 [Clitoria ternatea]|uniref:Uncharacterized protein n=1 Tax=Clitoria ternatea TaxID=43366 RepID=A0AAN9J5P3_CLITE
MELEDCASSPYNPIPIDAFVYQGIQKLTVSATAIALGPVTLTATATAATATAQVAEAKGGAVKRKTAEPKDEECSLARKKGKKPIQG